MRKLIEIESKNRIKHPYNPENISLRVQHFRVFELVAMIDKSSLFLNIREYNNESEIDNSRSWDGYMKSQFIESLIIKLPVPPIYLDGSQKPWATIDGIQRLRTIAEFISNNFPLINLEYLENEYNDSYFSDLPEHLRQRFLNAEIMGYVINPGTSLEIRYNIYKRLNSGLQHLKGQQVRNNFFQGVPIYFISKLAGTSLLDVVIPAVNSDVLLKRQEFVTRFIAFQLFGYTEYNGDMDLFLAETLISLYDLDLLAKNEITSVFELSMKRVNKFIENSSSEDYKSRFIEIGVSEWHFIETLAWNLADMEEWQFDLALRKQNDFNASLFNDPYLIESFRTGGDTKEVVQARFNKVSHLFKSLYND